MEIYLVVVHDTELRSREYAVLANSSEDASEKIAKGEFFTESESTVLDHIESKIVSAEKIGDYLEGKNQ